MATRLMNGSLYGLKGTWWGWKIDGYWDLHFAPVGVEPDGSEVVEEFFDTLAEARQAARLHNEIEERR